MMEVTATTKYVRLSPSKIRDLARTVQGKTVPVALNSLEFNTRKAAFHLLKTLKSAIANAENNAKLSSDELIVKRAAVEEGPRLKRFTARSRGMASPLLKRMCHIRIVLAEKETAAKAK